MLDEGAGTRSALALSDAVEHLGATLATASSSDASSARLNVPVGRLGEPDEIARTVSFLAAEDAGFITGANIPVNGGLFMSF
jgi:NAD(P)-dependent dehydrogenase (short-subunit alcohol dehydrogenase family)